MKRRYFLKAGAAAIAFAHLDPMKLLASEANNTSTPKEWSCEHIPCGPDDLHVRFLGTGAAGGLNPDGSGRRNSSILMDGTIMIDMTQSVLDMIPEGCHPETIFYTHTHGDHFKPEAALRIGIKQAYISETIAEYARTRFAEASEKTGIPAPEVIPMKIGERITEGKLAITPLPANHMSGQWEEQAQIYLIEKGSTPDRLGVRLLYATDTAGIMGKAARIVGIDPHITPGRPITGLIMEATMSDDEDFRIFVHSSTATVLRTARMLIAKGRLIPLEGQPVYLTHMANSLHPSQEEMDRTLPYPLRASYDGLETVFKAV